MRTILGVFAAAAIGLAPFPSLADPPARTIVRSVQSPRGATVRLVGLRNGAVRVVGVRDTTVSVRAAVLGDEAATRAVDVTASTNGHQTTVTIGGWPGGGNLVADVELRVPREDAVDVNSQNGSLALIGMAGAIKARTDNGDILIHGGATIDATTGNGNVVVDGSAGTMAVRTDVGHVTIVCDHDWRASAITATTGTGAIDLFLPDGGDVAVRATTKTGIVDVGETGGRTGGAPVKLTTGTGDIRVSRLAAP